MTTIDDLAKKASAATFKYWGPIVRPWAPCPYGETNLASWFKRHWAAHPATDPRTIEGNATEIAAELPAPQRLVGGDRVAP